MRRDPIEQTVYAERVAQLYAGGPSGATATLGIAALTVVVLWDAVPNRGLLLAWLAAHGGVMGLRAQLHRRYRRAGPPPEDADRWADRFTVLLACSGALWGAASVVFVPYDVSGHGLFMGFVLAGVVAGGATAYAGVARATWWFILPVLVPFVVRQLMGGTLDRAALALVGGVYLAFMAAASARHRQTLVKALTLGRRNERLASDLTEANQRLRIEVAERKQAQAQLRQSEARYRGVLGACPDPIVVYDPEGRVTYVNDAFERVYGWSSDEVVGARIEPFVPADEVEATADAWARTLDGEPVLLETRRFGKDGRERNVQVKTAVLRDSEETHAASIVVHRDVTALREAEARERRLEVEVQRAQKLESLGLMAAGVAHNFNNLLMVVLGNADLAKTDLPPGTRVREKIEAIETAARHAADISGRMFDYTGRWVSRTEPTDLSGLGLDAVSRCRRDLPEGVALEVAVEDNLPTVLGDPTRLEQAVDALLANAVEALGEGGGTIWLVTGTFEIGADPLPPPHPAWSVPDPGPHVYVEVSDDGPGMDEATVERVFDPFFTTRFMGRGLGLATVYGAVRDHGGVVEVESAPGGGSRFRILLPVGREPSGTATDPTG